MKILLFLLLFLTVGCLNHSLIRSQRKELVVDGVPTRVRLYSKNTNEYYVVFHGDYFSGVASKTIHYVFKEDIHNKNLYDGLLDITKDSYAPSVGSTNILGKRIIFKHAPYYLRNLILEEYFIMWDI